MPNLSALAIRNRAVTLLLMIALLLGGTYAFFALGRAEDPKFTVKVMTVSALWPGATVAEMREQVADPLEKRLQELRWYDRTETIVRPGAIVMTVWLQDTSPPSAVPGEFYQVRKKLTDEALRLPRGVIGPLFNDEFSDVYFSLFALQAEGLPQRALVAEAERLRSRLLGVPGVAKVVILGERPERIYVDLDPVRLATLGIAPQAIFEELAAHDTVVDTGAVETSGQTVALRVGPDTADPVAAIRAIPVAAGGRVTRISDLANVSRGLDDPPTQLIRHNGKPTLLLGVVMRERWNGLALGAALAAEHRLIRAELPLGMRFEQTLDQSRVIAEANGEFMLKFAVALSVVLIVSLAALGPRVGLVVAASVPLTLSGVFLIMLATDRDFDRVTLGALILSLGLLVDDAIIAIEMMVVKMAEGLDRVAAATFAWGSTAKPMLTGTFVTIIGFLPIGFAQSSAGEYAGNIFWVVAFALIISWFVAVYFTPYLGVKMLPETSAVEGGREALYGTRAYRWLRARVAGAVARPSRVLLPTALLFAGAAALLALFVPQQFFPNSERQELLIEVNMPKGSAIARTEAVVRRIEGDVIGRRDVVGVDAYVGTGAPRFFLALNPEPPDPAFAKLVVATASPAARDALKAALERDVAAGRYAEARVRATQLLFGPPVAYPVAFRVGGPDPATVRLLAEQVAAVIRAHQSTRDVAIGWGERAPVLQLDMDRDRLAALGLNAAAVARQTSALTTGLAVAQLRERNRIVDLVVRMPRADPLQLEALGSLPVSLGAGQTAPLGSLARLNPGFDWPYIETRDRLPTVTVGADLEGDVQAPDVTHALLPQLSALSDGWPPGYRLDTAGAAEESDKANAALGPTMPIMLALIVLAIMLHTNSFKMTGFVLATAPLGLIGAVPALLLTGMPFGFTAILGLIGLAGVLMRNTLILVDQIEVERRRGCPDAEAVVEATVVRARPVMLTALAAVLAFLPLAFSPFWGALAVVLMGGTIAGTVLTLFFLPALYAAFFPKLSKNDSSGRQLFLLKPHQS